MSPMLQRILLLAPLVLTPTLAHADCSGLILCATYDYTIPVTITTPSLSPALTVMGGNVGFGTTTPAEALSVVGKIQTTDGIKFADGTIQTTASTGGGTSSQWTTTGSNISYSTGSVGVGTTTPAEALSVVGKIQTTGGIKFNDGTTQTTAATSGTPSQWATSGSNISYVAGNVGVGTTTPAAPLEVSINSDSGSTVRIKNTSTGSSALTETEYDNGAYNISIGLGSVGHSDARLTGRGYVFQYGTGLSLVSEASTTATDIRLYTGATPAAERMRVTGTGNVGIGVTNPTAKLDVNGTIRGSIAGNFSSIYASMSDPGSGAGGSWNYSSYTSCPAGTTLIMKSLTTCTGASSNTYQYCTCEQSGNSLRAGYLSYGASANPNFYAGCQGLCVK